MTDDSFDHDRIDERVRKLAKEHYNPRRGIVPREAMWASVVAARRAERARSESAGVIPIHTPRRAHWRWGAAALAAGLLLGVVVDRTVVARDGAANSPVATRVTGREAPPAPPAVAEPTQQVARATPESIAHGARPERLADRSAGAPRRVASPAVPDQDPDPAPSRALADGRPTPDPRGLYQAAAVQTLVQAEALLTNYRRAEAGQRDTEAMQQAARWSRDVLSSTRLLLDSPAARDPRLRQLLTDLELVLAQIVQLSGAPLQAGERELIERAMRDRDLLPRLRAVVPAGATAS